MFPVEEPVRAQHCEKRAQEYLPNAAITPQVKEDDIKIEEYNDEEDGSFIYASIPALTF
jgi:hypothetical protein